MRRDIRMWLALGMLVLVCTATSARAQVSPANMQSGCVNFAAGVGLLETSLYVVPPGSSFVLTDFSFTPSGYPTAPVTATWAVSMWVRNWNLNNDVRWVTGGLWDANGNHNWPVHANWTTGIVFPSNEVVRFGIGGSSYPASTVCWSGYLVPNSTSSVPPTLEAPPLGIRAAPNPSNQLSSDTQPSALRRHPVFRTSPPVNCVSDSDFPSDLLSKATPSLPHRLSCSGA